jgi:hypothetical protein
VESELILDPMSLKFIKFIKFEFPVGFNKRCAGVDDNLFTDLPWKYFHKVLAFNVLDPVFVYFSELPTIDE